MMKLDDESGVWKGICLLVAFDYECSKREVAVQ